MAVVNPRRQMVAVHCPSQPVRVLAGAKRFGTRRVHPVILQAANGEWPAGCGQGHRPAVQ